VVESSAQHGRAQYSTLWASFATAASITRLPILGSFGFASLGPDHGGSCLGQLVSTPTTRVEHGRQGG